MAKRHYLVVGGTRGTGQALVQHLLGAAENHVSVVGRSAATGATAGPRLGQYAADVTDLSALRAVLDAAVQAGGGLDGIVFMQRHRAAEEDFEADLQVALTATRSAIDHLVASGSLGRNGAKCSIVMVSSIAGHYVAPEQDLGYHVSKAGLEQLARYYALRLGPQGVRVNIVSPCVVIKEAARQFYSENSWITDRFEHFIPLQRAGSSQDIVDAIMFFLGGQSAYITGQNLVVDGGLTLRSHESILRDFPRDGRN